MTKTMCEYLWNEIPADSAIKSWASELKSITKKPFDNDEWALVGHGVVIEHEHPEDFKTYLSVIAQSSGMEAITLDAPKVMDIDLLQKTIRTDTPTILYLEPDYWVNPSIGEDEDRGFALSMQRDEELASRFRKCLTEDIFKALYDQPIVLVISLRTAQQLDESLRAVGLFDRKIKFPEIDRITQANAFVTALENNLLDDSILNQLEQVGLILEEHFSDMRRRALMIMALKRLAWRQKRKISVRDLIEVTIYGTIEEDYIKLDHQTLQESSIHEAGHAVMAYLDSSKKSAPLYCAVGKRGDMSGVVMRQCNSITKVSDNESFQETIHSIRVCLAGRAAEELVNGIQNTSAGGASSDLKEASRLANRMFGRYGYPVQGKGGQVVGSNIAVVIGQPTNSEYQYIEAIVRDFLQDQYQQVMTILAENRTFLEYIASAIASRGIVLQDEFEALASEWFNEGHKRKAA